jgi:glycosyltransferase involved in cell wall biosynthesis
MLEGINDTSLVVIHNWADIDKISPIKPKNNSFRRDLGLQDKLVISYSGNLGLSHDLSTLLTAAKMLKTDKTVAFLIIGEGPQKAIIKSDVEKFNLTNVTLLPYQPDDILPLSLSSGDFSVVTLNREMDKLTIPSKLYPAMAAGQAIIAIFTEDTDIADIVTENNAGIVIEQGDSENFVREISKLNKNRELIKAMKNNARQTVVSKYSRDISVNRYCELLLECSKVVSSS